MKPARSVVTAEDFWRLHPPTRLPFREWQHFIVVVPGLELLVNFNVDQPPGEAPRRGRIIVIARTDRWHGVVEAVEPEALRVSADGLRARFGEHTLELDDHGYQLQLSCPRQQLSVSLRFSPQGLPMIAPAQGVGGARRLSWIMMPRGLASGRVSLGEQRWQLRDAVAYHDHNWGHFRWGDDFSWEWGVALPCDPSRSDALVLSSLQNRARSELVREQVFVWGEGRNLLTVSGAELQVCAHGPARGLPAWVLPAVMSLVRGRADADLPERLELRVGGERGQLRACFRPEAVAELVVPSDRDPLGTVSIHECIGAVTVQGQIRGHGPVDWEGRGVFEFLRA